MITNLLQSHLACFPLTFTASSLAALTKCLDPFNYKYRRPFNLIAPEENILEMINIRLTPKVIQLSLIKFCLNLAQTERKANVFWPFCEFFVKNLQEISAFLADTEGGTAFLILFALNQMARSWVLRGNFNTEVSRNLKNFESIILSLKAVLQQHLIRSHTKKKQQIITPSSKITGVSPASQLAPRSYIQSAVYPSSKSDTESSPLELKVDFEQPIHWREIMLNVYLGLLSIYCFNDQSKVGGLMLTTQFKSSVILNNSNEEQSAYFHTFNFPMLLSHSLNLLFHLSNGSQELKLITELFVTCSQYIVFRDNEEKPVSFLRMVEYGEMKLEKKLWTEAEWGKEEEDKFMQLVEQHLMLDPAYRPRLLSLINQWIFTGVQIANCAFLAHWRVLLTTINRRIFPQLEAEVFKLLLQKSQGNKHHRQHVTRLLSQMITHLDAEILLKNCDQLFGLEELIDDSEGKLLVMFFGYCFAQVRNGKLRGVRRLVNRVLGMYLRAGKNSEVKKADFLEFLSLCVQSSVETGEKFLSEANWKRLHMAKTDQGHSQSLITSSKRLQTSCKQLLIPADQPSEPSAIRTPIFQVQTQSQQQIFSKFTSSKKDSEAVPIELQLLEEFFVERRRGESYFFKLVREVSSDCLDRNNIQVYELYGRYLRDKFTEFSTAAPEEPLLLILNPNTFHRLLALYESLHAIIDQNKVLSHELYQSLLTIECLVETATLSQRHAWFVRKLKYLFYVGSAPIKVENKDFGEGNRKSSSQINNGRNSESYTNTLQTCQKFWAFVRDTFFRMKNKTSFLMYICLFCLRYYQSAIRRQRKSEQRCSQKQHDYASQLSELYVFLQTHDYASVLCPSIQSTAALFILYNLVLACQHALMGLKARDDCSYFEEIDDHPILTEIRKILVVGLDVASPYQLDQFLYMFTLRDSPADKLMAYMNLLAGETLQTAFTSMSPFENLPLISRLLPVIKVACEATCRKCLSLQKKQLILSFYNHLEFFPISQDKPQLLRSKSNQKNYVFTIDMLFNWSIKAENFISFCTSSCKSKLVISKDKLSLFFRKQGSGSTEKSLTYRFRKELAEKALFEICLKRKELSVVVNRKLVAVIPCEDNIQSLKLEMINGLIVRRVSVAIGGSQNEISQQPIPQVIKFQKSLTYFQDLQLEIRLKDLAFISHQAVCATFPYAKYFFLLKELVKHNLELGVQNVYEFLSKNLCEMYLKMLENHVMLRNELANSLKIGLDEPPRENVQNGDEPQQMWRGLMKVLFEAFVDLKNNYCLMRKRTQTVSKVERKYSHDVTFLKGNLSRSNSTKDHPDHPGQNNILENQTDNFLSPPLLPSITSLPSYICTDGFSVYILQALLKTELWEWFSDQVKLQVAQYLKKLMEIKNFLYKVENKRLDVFIGLLELLENLSKSEQRSNYYSLEKSPVSPLTVQNVSNPVSKTLGEAVALIILHHDLTLLLKEKFRYFFYLAETGKSQFVKNQFYALLDRLSRDLLTSSTVSGQPSIGCWLLLQFEQFEFVFMNCSLTTKVKILDYLTEFAEEEDRLAKFMKQLAPEVIFELRMWLLIFLKKMLFRLKMKSNVLKCMKILGEVTCVLLMCWEEVRVDQEREQMMKILSEEIEYISERQKTRQPIANELARILSQQQFVRFLVAMVEEFVLRPNLKSGFSPQKFCQTVFEVIFRLEKRSLLQVLTSYRRYCDKDPALLAYPIKLELTRYLGLYQLSCFLQYILECILSIENSLAAEETGSFAMQLKTYLEFLMKNYEHNAQVECALLYCYPKVYRWGNCSVRKEVADRLSKVAKVMVKELRGGVHFKLMVIVSHLIELKPDEDMSWIVEHLLFRGGFSGASSLQKGEKELQAAFRATNDFSEVQCRSKQRHYIERLVTSVEKGHRSYCRERDQPYDPLQVVSNKLVKFEEENDLTPYCLDYFLMKIVNYLQWQDESDPAILEINIKYSELIIMAFRKFPLIYNDITEKNILSEICVNDYSELLLLMGGDELLVAQKVTSPSRYEFELDTSTPKKDYLDESYFQKLQTKSPSKSSKNIQLYESERFSKTVGKKDDQFLNPGATLNPKKVSSRKKSFNALDVRESKDFLIEEVKKDHKNWRKKCLQKQFNKFFRNEAKELLIIELLFTYFVDNTALKPSSQVFQKQNRMIQKYFQSFQQQLQKLSIRDRTGSLSTKQLVQIFNLKRLYPYLMQKPPILKVKGSSLPSMCLPMLAKIPKPNYKLREDLKPGFVQSVVGEQLRMEMFGFERQEHISDAFLPTFEDDDQPGEIQFQQNFIYTPKKSVMSDSQKSYRPNSCICVQENDFQLQPNHDKSYQVNYCELVTRKGVYFCQWKITLRSKPNLPLDPINLKKSRLEYILQLQSFKSKPMDCPRVLKYGSPISNLITQQKLIQIQISSIYEIFYRKYNQILNNSVEMFCNDGRAHFLCLYSSEKAEKIVKEIQLRLSSGLKVIKNAAGQFKKRGYMAKWVNGEIDNFTYLMLLNKYSGRSFCDTNQYPVFPWVVRDFKSKILNLSEISSYRDLTKPIGALNPQKLRRFYEKYHMQTEQTGIYLYGSHFSTSLFIYYFLVRMEPFSTLHQEMQGGSWDAPDRLFSSMEHMWESLMSASSATDIKEAIPEFYYFPFFLKNTNSIDLGVRQSGEIVNDVILPPWASSPEDFIFKMRSALQSNYVSLNLPYWIDLIFGCDQKNIKRHNLYHPLSYSENIHIEKIQEKDLQARICQISYFGQHPIRLFNKAHKLKKLAINSIFSRESLPGIMLRGSSLGKRQGGQCVMMALNQGLSIVKIYKSSKIQKSTICALKIRIHTLNLEFDIEIDPKVESIDIVSKKIYSSLKECERTSKNRYSQTFSNSDKKSQPPKFIRDPNYIGFTDKSNFAIQSHLKSNLLFFHPNSHPLQILSSYSFPQRYCNHLYTETFVILYGEDGIVLINWNFEEIFAYRKRAIDCCFVDDLVMVFGSRDGKVFVYDMVQKTVVQAFELNSCEEEIRRKEGKSQKGLKSLEIAAKQQKIYSTQMGVFPEKKLISTSCEEEYKIVAVANGRKLFILNYKQTKKNWTNPDKQ